MATRAFSLLVLAAMCAATPPLVEDEHRSHAPVPGLGSDPDPMKLFQKRWQLAKGLEELRKKHPNLLRPEKVEDLAKHLRNIDLKDPKLRAQLEALLQKQDPNLRLTPEQIEALERLVKEAFPEGKVGPDNLPRGVEVKPPTQPPDEKKLPGSPEKPPEPISPEERERQGQAEAEASRQLNQFARGLERLADNLNDSPALRQTLQDLGAMALRHAGERPNGSPGELNSWLARANRLGSDGDGWLAKNWPHLRSLNLDRLSAPRMPSVSVPWRRPSLPALPSGPASVGVGSDSWKPLLMVVFVVALIVTLVRFLRRHRRAQEELDEEWRVGPWPVNPAEVRTRDQLVRTFEYFSLLRLGRKARTWNHRTIARRLANERSAESLTVGELAALYEKARYAPADEPLTEEALAAYRRDLCSLAGVAGQ